MKYSFLISSFLVAPFSMANLYDDAQQTIQNAPTEIKTIMESAPNTYQFNGQFSRSSSVSYTGQVFRNVLIEDIKGAMTSQLLGQYPGSIDDAKNMLLSYYKYSENTNLFAPGSIDGFSDFKVNAKNPVGVNLPIFEGFIYSDIQSPGKNLYGKVAGVDNSLRRGKLFGIQNIQTPDDLLNNWFNAFAKNAVEGKVFTIPNGNLAPQTITGAYTSEDGLDYAQLTQKFLLGAVSYSQAARDYLSTDLGPNKGLNADNTTPAEQGANYTAMEHHFDEAFGYFGAAKDYLAYGDKLAREKLSLDSNNDGLISLKSEKNLGIAPNSARIDLTAFDQDLNLSEDIMNAFLRGRNLITKKPQGYKKYVEAQAQIILTNWEKTLAGLTIHYINKTISEYKSYGTENYLYEDFVKFWGEMKGFSLSFQFNPKSLMNDATFDQIQGLLGDRPVLPHAGETAVNQYMAALQQIRDLIGKTYNFSDNNIQNW